MPRGKDVCRPVWLLNGLEQALARALGPVRRREAPERAQWGPAEAHNRGAEAESVVYGSRRHRQWPMGAAGEREAAAAEGLPPHPRQEG